MKYNNYLIVLSLLLLNQETISQTYPSLYGSQEVIGDISASITTTQAVTKTTDGNYIIAGTINDNLWMIKIDGTSGDTIWTSRPLGGSGTEGGPTAHQAPDGHYLMTGTTNSLDGDVRGFHPGCGFCSDIWIVKLDSATGDTIWTSRALGGSGSEFASYSFVTSDDNFLIIGSSSSPDGDVRGLHGASSDIWAIKLNIVTGDTIWTSKALGGTNIETPRSGFESSSGDYVIAVGAASSDGDVRGQHVSTCGFIPCSDYWIIKLNSNTGDTVWTSRALGGTGNDKAIFVNEALDGSLLVGGSTTSSDGDVRGFHPGICGFGNCRDYWVIRLDSNTGDTIATSRALGGSDDDIPGSSFKTADNNFIISGTTWSSDGDVRGQHGNSDLWLTKFNSITLDTIATSRTFGGIQRDELVLFSPTCDSGYLFSGFSQNVTANGDISTNSPAGTLSSLWMAKVDDNLALEWNRTWSDGTSAISAHRVVPANDGGYIYIGKANEPLLEGDKTVPGLGIWIAKFYWLDAGFSADTVCEGIPTTFIDSSKGVNTAQPGVTWQWDFGDGFTSSLQTPSHIFTNSGSFLVSLIITKECNSDTFVRSVFVKSTTSSFALANDSLSICIGDSAQFSASGGESYLWTPNSYLDNDTLPNPISNTPFSTNYSVAITDSAGCMINLSLSVFVDTIFPLVDLGSDIQVCDGVNKILSNIAVGSSYLWSTNETTRSITNNSSGLYWLEVTGNSCTSRDSLIREGCPEGFIYAPNAFSPNADGTNDIFTIRGEGIGDFVLKIFNRWGRQVFESIDINSGWNGLIGASAVNKGVYVYIITGEYVNGTAINLKGNVTLVR